MCRQIYASIAIAVLMLGMMGCGAFKDEYPYPQPYRVMLKVADMDGNPFPGAAVWIDNDLMSERTAAAFTPLGQGFPSEWQDWEANFVSPILYTSIDFGDDVDPIQLLVTKTGHVVVPETFEIWDVRGTFFKRFTIIMQPIVCP